jgi:hypothetical protein
MKIAVLLLVAFLRCGLFPANSHAANPFLSVPNDKPVSAPFRGTEWGDEIGPKDLPLSAKVVTTRIAQAPWGAIFKISFENIVSKADPKRELQPVYYIVTDDEILLLNEEDNMAAAQKLAAEAKPPTFDPTYVQGISKGTRKSSDKLTETSIVVKGNRCTYSWSHNSGHFTTVIWQKGVGLIEYAQGRGARADGYRLKRVVK